MRDPKTSFTYTLMVLVPTLVFTVVMPLALSISINPDLSLYLPGEFAVLGRQIGGRWLGGSITFAAIVSQVGSTLAAWCVTTQ